MNSKDIKFKKNDKFLITGGAGFIGSNIIEALLKRNCKVRAIDNFITGKRENIESFQTDKNFEFIEGDICNFKTCNTVCTGIDYILHQAALGSVPRSIEHPQKTHSINVNGTLNMLLAAKEKGVKRFVYASSSSVYGDSIKLPKKEGEEGIPLSPYAITKKINELYAKNFFSLYGLKTIGLRYFNVFGKRQDPDSQYSAVIPLFIKKLLRNERPVINGDGMQSRDFTYIDNVVEANLLACVADTKAWGEIFNIAYGEQVTLNTLFENLSVLLNKNITPEYGPERTGDIRHSNADIKMAKEIMGYEPCYDFFTGLKLTIQWYKENYKQI